MNIPFTKTLLLACLAPLILTALTLTAYWQAPENGFHFDDYDSITAHTPIQISHLSIENLYKAGSEAFSTRRPLPSVTFALDWLRGNGSPAPFQWTNIILHTLTAMVVFLLTRLLLQLTYNKNNHLTAIAILCASIWAVHPIQSQAVTYIVQRMTILAALFSIISVICYIKYRTNKTRDFRWLLAALFSFLAAAASKENAWITPFLWLLAEFGICRRNKRQITYRSDMALILLPLVTFIAIVIDIWVISGPLSNFLNEGYKLRDFTLEQRLLTQPGVILFHLQQMLWPFPGAFSIEHDITISNGLFSPPSTIASIFFILLWVVSALTLFFSTRYRFIGFSLLWVFVTLIIESTIVPLEMIFEHRMYLPSVGLILLLSAFLHYFVTLPGRVYSYSATLIAGAFLLFCLYSTTQRVPQWKDNITLYQSALSHAPNSIRLKSNLARSYLEAGNYQKAKHYISQVMESNPFSTYTIETLAVMAIDQGDLKTAEQLLSRLSVSTDSASVNNHYGELLLKLNRPKEAISHFERAIFLRPRFPNYYWNYALALEQSGDCRHALQQWREYLILEHIEQDKKLVQRHIKSNYKTIHGDCFPQQ